MELGDLMANPEFKRQIMSVITGLPRLISLVAFSPFFPNSVINGQLMGAVVLVLFFLVYPMAITQMPPSPAFNGPELIVLIVVVIKEVLVGFFLAYVSGIIFLATQSAGFLMDNQRGASMAQGPDSMSGDETSPLGSLLFQSLIFIFFVSGAFLGFIRVFMESYQIWPILTFWPDFFSGRAASFFISLVDFLMAQMLLLAGPVVVAALLTDAALGLINRFASQLNVYILSMPIKSGLTMFMIIFYYTLFIHLSPELFAFLSRDILFLERIWP